MAKAPAALGLMRQELPPVHDGLRAAPVSDSARLALIDRLGLRGRSHDGELDAIVETMAAATDAPMALISIVTPNLQTHPAELGLGSASTRVPDHLSFCAQVVTTARSLQVADARIHPTFAANPFVVAGTVRSYAGEPLVYQGQVIGSVSLFDSAPRRFTDLELRVLRAQARLTAALIALRATAAWDRLTGLALRPLLLDRVRRETAPAGADSRDGRRAAILVLDVLGLTAINGAFGSKAGDRVLVTLSERLRAACRPTELPARIGGDEFAVLLADAGSRADARLRAAQLIGAVSAPPEGGALPIVVRSGLATSSSAGADALLAAAERSLGRRRRGDPARLLDATDSPTCAVTGDGTIRAVNGAWREFTTANAGDPATCGTGANYLAVCDQASGASSAGAAAVAAGLRQVLSGGLPRFEMDYPCHAPDEMRWFSLRIVRQPHGAGALLSHHNVTGTKIGASPERTQTGDRVPPAAVVVLGKATGRGPGQLRALTAGRLVAPAGGATPADRLLEAIAREEFVLHYQPVVDLLSGAVVSVEALVRWQHPTDGLLGPDLFIPLAEATGAIVALGEWVLAQACAQAVAWHSQGLPLHMAVNLSSVQVGHPGFVDTVSRTLRSTGIDPQKLGFEVTESAVMADAEAAVEVFKALTALGTSLSIDDFGTGYSSLIYLKRYPIRALKIDRGFVGGMGVSEQDDAIVASVIGLARAVGGTCVAEGVETPAQLAALRALGCRYGQGWLFGKGVPAEELPNLVSRCEQDLGLRLLDLPPPGVQRDLAAEERDHAAGERDHAAGMRDDLGDARDQVRDQRDHRGDERDVVGDQRDNAADARDEVGMRRDLAADERDHTGDVRDELGARRDRAGDQRDDAADQRDRLGGRRDRAGDRRDDAADQRDRLGARRDEAGDQRDRAADKRDQAAERRDDAAEQRDCSADARDRAAAQSSEASLVAVVRQEAASDRSRASRDRKAGARERTQAGRDRTIALADRGAGAGERTQAVGDRTTALVERGAGATERSQAEQDRAASLGDRGTGALERSQAEQDRATSSGDRGTGAMARAHAERDRDVALADRVAGATERGQAKLDRATALADRDAGAVERNRAERDRGVALADRGAAADDRTTSSRDALTGVYGRGAGLAELRREIGRARRGGQPITVAFVDVDGLKAVNDEHGHAVGDDVLRSVARAMVDQLRSYDLVVRYGGDEFLCVLAGMEPAEVERRFAGVNALLATMPWASSVTMGCAVLQRGDDAEKLVERADRELYRVRKAAQAG